jgi:hypothetical protein
VTVFAVPTSAGIATVECAAPAGDRVVAECDRAAATLELRRGEPLALRPDAKYGESVQRVMRQLQPLRRSLRQRLGKARTRAEQSEASGAMAQAYDRAARGVGRIDPPGVAANANEAIADAMRQAASAYGGMRKAAVAFDVDGWERGKGRVRAAEARVQGSLDALRQLGYTIL